jgi:hypothetical protein
MVIQNEESITNDEGIANEDCDSFLVTLYNNSIHKNTLIDRNKVEVWLRNSENEVTPCTSLTYDWNIVLSSSEFTTGNNVTYTVLYDFLSKHYYGEFFKIILQYNKVESICKKIEYTNLENIGYVILFS